MAEQPAPEIDEIKTELARFPSSVLEEFEKASTQMPASLTEPQLADWAGAGLELARKTVRSWEASAQYFKVSPTVLGYMPLNYFFKWTDCGQALCAESPTLATAYFEASPGTMSKLRSRHIESWSGLGRSLYKGTWKSSTLACKFFQSSPALLEHLSFPEMERFVSFLGSLSHRSYDLSSECLTLGQEIFPLIGEDRAAFISLASTLVESGWREVKSFFEAGSRALPRIEAAQRLRFLKLAENLVKSGGTNIPGVMLEISNALSQIEPHEHAHILGLGESLMVHSPAAVPEFIKACPKALEKVTMSQLEKWFSEGVGILEQNPDGGLAFFKIESARSEEVLEALSSGVEFGRIKDVMEMYCRALAGADLKLAEAGELVDKNIGWVSNEAPSTEGSTVFVPSLVDKYSSKEDNFAWFKVVSTHQVAHLEFGSFLFDFETPSVLFTDRRQELERQKVHKPGEATRDMPDVEAEGVERAWVTDAQRFFDLFQDRKLALDIYTVVEDARLDARVKVEYPGIRLGYDLVQGSSLKERPEITEMPVRQALVEFLVRLSLNQYDGIPAPEQFVDEAREIGRIIQQVLRPEATVQDTAEASLRIYAIIGRIPNEEVPPEDWEDVDLEDTKDEQYQDPDDMEQLLQQIAMGMDMEMRPEGEQDYDSTEDVEFRGDFKPELVQLLTELRMQQGEGGGTDGEPISQEQLEELLKNSAELELQATQGELQDSSNMMANNLMKEAGLDMPQSPEYGKGPLVHVDEDGGALEASEPQTFVYDEWDFRADDYKPRWCIVKQKTMAEGDPTYYSTTLSNYGTLVTQIRRQFEMMVPEMFRKVRKLDDGDEIDIDDLIEAMVDRKTGVSPSEKFYWRRNKVQRDVAVAFLLDTSASTAEAIDDAKKSPDDWDAPDDPVEYMVWLRTRRGEAMRRSYKRIIDVEKEAIVLLINALEAVGDVYGIYGFSGYGRENVEFYTIKDLDETFSERVKKRIDKVAPLHATRMGPAIRHTTYKLDKQDARTKLMFLISDGRPQDRGYSREGVEKEYAVHDTKKALDEAKAKGIQAFALTVDKNGHDYLKTMCEDIGYEVLDDIYELPSRLLYLYKKLTM
ncbi:MAG: VWA domain-containing protein [Chloroflexi bacterium]|nr:VWA domain-containing protein [Chloroflexota bacterium]